MSNLFSQTKQTTINVEMIDNEIKIAKIFNEYFVDIVKNLGILTENESETFTEKNLSEVKWLYVKIQKPS